MTDGGGESLPGLAPHQLLTEGIQTQLAQRLAQVLTATLAFPGPPQALTYDSSSTHAPSLLATAFGGAGSLELIQAGHELFRKLQAARKWLASLRSSLECTQHVLGIQALPMWNAEMELLTQSALAAELKPFQLESPGVPSVKQPSPVPTTWLGLIASELLRITEPHLMQFSQQQMAWVGAGEGQAAPLQLFRLLHEALGTPALGALHQLLERRQASARGAAGQLCRAELLSGLSGPVGHIAEALPGLRSEPEDGPALYAEISKRCSRLWPRLEACLAAAGQAALLQASIAHQLRHQARVQCAETLHGPLETLQQATHLEVSATSPEATGHPMADRISSRGSRRASARPRPISVAPASSDGSMALQRPPRRELALSVQSPQGRNASPAANGCRPLPGPEASAADACGPEAPGLNAWLRLAGMPDRTGLVSWLCAISKLQDLLQLLGDSIHTHIQAATSMAAHGARAAGIEVTMPPEVSLLVGFGEAIVERAGRPASHLHQFISPYICAAAHTIFADHAF
ncbi:hypothetical protein WJX84_008298 [Apatococcus fuscideae]|uniref:Uncharacterized protein n=1 Tax=Apatococcus fuscideae TaxID=2026836 RepID=A0AAW1T4K4_9CHLO